MGLPQTCCGCCSLQTGGLVLGWYGIISSILDIAAVAIAMANAEVLLEKWRNNGAEININISSTFIYLLITCIITLLIYVLLLVGAHMRKHVFLLPWLIVQMITIVGGTLLVVILGIMCFVGEAIGLGIVVFLIGLAINGLLLYWWLCMASLYKGLRQEANNPPGVVYHPGTHVPSGIPPSYEQVAHKV